MGRQNQVLSEPGSRVNAYRLYGGIGSIEGFNVTAIVLYAIPALMSTLVFDRTRFGGNDALWVLIAIVGYSVAVALFVLGGLVYRRIVPRFGEYPILVQLYFAAIGLIRASVIFLLGRYFGLIPESDLLWRLISGPIYTGVTLGICVIIGINFERNIRESARLIAERKQLAELQQTMKLRIETQRAELVGRVRGILAPAINSVRQQLKSASNSAAIIETLTKTVDEVVRPLSHDIAATEQQPEPLSSAKARGYIPAISPMHRIDASRLFLPQLSALLIAITAFPAALALKPGFEGFIAGVLHGLIALLVLGFIKGLVQGRRMPILYAAMLVVLGFSAVEWLVLFLAEALRIPFSEQETANILMFGLVFGITFAIGQAVQVARGEAVTELKSVIAATELLVSRLRQEIWLNNRKMASVLHGPIQTALYAASMKLSSAKKITPQLVAEAESDITSALDRLDLSPSEQEDFAEVITQIVSLWRGSCEISVFIDENASTKLYADKNAGACVVEVVQEAISNAIKHGRASNASVMISLTKQGTAEVRVRNDGKPLDVKAQGFGSQLLDEICHRWQIVNDGRGVLLTAEIALA